MCHFRGSSKRDTKACPQESDVLEERRAPEERQREQQRSKRLTAGKCKATQSQPSLAQRGPVDCMWGTELGQNQGLPESSENPVFQQVSQTRVQVPVALLRVCVFG